MIRYRHFNQAQGRTMQVTGTVQSVYLNPTKKSGVFQQRLRVNNEFYSQVTQYPVDVAVGDKVSFDCQVNGQYKNIALGTLKVDETNSMGNPFAELMQYMEINFRQLNDKMDSILTKVPKKEQKPQVEEGFDDDLPF